MSYSLRILWFERSRYFAAVLAVAFSAMLICVQFGVLLGTFSLTSIPIDNARAEIWIGSPDVVSVDVGRSIPREYLTRLARQPEVVSTEYYNLGFNYWTRPDGGAELCIVVGTDLADGSLGSIPQLTPKLRSLLTEPGSVVVDRSELGRLGIQSVGQLVQLGPSRARVVGLVEGVASLQGPYVFCSVQTAKELLHLPPNHTTYILGKCKNPDDAATVVRRLQDYPDMTVLSSSDFSFRTRWHWLTRTQAGVALGFAAVLGLLVGAIVTRQSLYSATVASLREYAVLRALGIPRWRMALNLASVAFWVGVAGVALGLPMVYGVTGFLVTLLNLPIQLPWWLVLSSVLVTWSMAILAGLSTLRSLNQVEPMILLR
jgi:putative ABC transport system permease protein